MDVQPERGLSRRQLLDVAVLSAAGLLLELVMIRWLDSQVRILAYVKNLPLIGSFLGLGLGFATHKRRRIANLAVPLVCLVLGTALFLGSDKGVELLTGPASPESNLGVVVAQTTTQLAIFFAAVTALFGLVVLAMVPVGQLTADAMEGLPSLPGYTANVAGSLAGVLASFALAAVSGPPWLTAAIVLNVIARYGSKTLEQRITSIIAIVMVCGGMLGFDNRPHQETIWSPYNKIEVHLPDDGRFPLPLRRIRVQNLYYQQIINLADDAPPRWRAQEIYAHWRNRYDDPYRWKPRPNEVLIFGAGTGNDVAAALRNGAAHVDAVEIDPRIVDVGRRFHPEHPYADPRVRIITTDARAFLRAPGKKYDLIVFGLLDAHTSFYSSMAGGIRLDNYVYTVDAFRQALTHLTPDGVLALSFYIEHPWLMTRMDKMVEAAAGHPAYAIRNAADAVTFMTGPGAHPPPDRRDVTVGVPQVIQQAYPPGPNATDDWPFLYLRDRSIPPTIIAYAIGIAIATALIVWIFFRGQTRFDRHFFFLGAGFLLLETRTIAQFALLFGTTWRVSALTIAGILLLILIANVIIEKRGAFPLLPLYLLLAAVLVVNYLVPVGAALGRGLPATIGMAALLSFPLFIAALIFGSSVAGGEQLPPILASNLVGAVLGGLLENVSLVIGISALSLVAVGIYALSYRRRA